MATLRGWLAGWEGSHARFETERVQDALPDAVVRVLQGDRKAAGEGAAALTALSGEALRRAVRGLADLGVRDPSVRDALANVTTRGDDVASREAGVALSWLGDPRGEQIARLVLREGPTELTRRAALGLARLGSAEGVRVLSAWVIDRSAQDSDRDAVIAVLEELHAPETLDAWLTLLDDPRLAPVAATALGALHDARAIGPLRRTLETTRYARTRRAVLDALRILGAPDLPAFVLARMRSEEGLADPFEMAGSLNEPGHAIAGATTACGPIRRTVAWTGPALRGQGNLYVRVDAERGGTLTIGSERVPYRATRPIPWRGGQRLQIACDTSASVTMMWLPQ